MNTKSMLSVKNRLWLKKGESLEDQVIGRKGTVGLVELMWLVGLGILGVFFVGNWRGWWRGGNRACVALWCTEMADVDKS